MSPAVGSPGQDVEPSADLKQITLVLPENASADEKRARRSAFEAAVKQIRACSDVESVAAGIDGEVAHKEKFPLSQTPPGLAAQLRKLGAGGVTQVFGDDMTLRILIRCDG